MTARKEAEGVEFFRQQFHTLTGFEPMGWQRRLFRDFAAARLPTSLGLPTGLGKTSVMAIWLIALAYQLRVGARPRLPLRLIYIVDRRAIVDQATTFAQTLRERLAAPEARELREALGLVEGQELPISTLRGQFVDSRKWLENPAIPAVIVGTVDMVGSRLLFQGYGVSRRMRPYHAGLLGVDSLMVLDEAHLVPPFQRLLERIASGRDANGRPLRPTTHDADALVPPIRHISLSATGGLAEKGTVFELDAADVEEPIVRMRIEAQKRVMLLDPVPAAVLPDALAEQAWRLAGEGNKPVRVVVFCSSRDHAQKVQGILHRRASEPNAIATELLVGERRVHERQAVAQWLETHGFIADRAAAPQMPSFLIATAAGEVGVDLDADHAACDVVAWERMVQRLGRVNRRGTGDAVVVAVPSEVEEEQENARRQASCELICMLPLASDDCHDASPKALASLNSNAPLRPLLVAATTPDPLHPPLTLALVEAWAMTSLEEHTGRPEVGPWIRGWPETEERPQTTLTWRRHLPVDDEGRLFTGRSMETYREAAAPHLVERLEAETWRVLDWLAKRIKVLQSRKVPDAHELGPTESLPAHGILGVVFEAAGGRSRVLRASDLAPEKRRDTERALSRALLLVDCRLGGLKNGLLLDESDEPVLDVTEVDGSDRVVPFRIRRADELPDTPLSDDWRVEMAIVVRRQQDKDTAWLVIESVMQQGATSEEGRSGSSRSQYLHEHQEWTEMEARKIATSLVPKEYGELLAVSAALHDEGKRAERWQRAFNAPLRGGEPYAKTTVRPNLSLLDGYRHELGSLPYAEAHERFKSLPGPLRDLCLHLIVSHHGSGRPLIETASGVEPESRLEARAREVALRFLALQRAWGPWGLAWFECLLRAADQQASRQNDQEGRTRG